ncbi:uncharacterized protein LOC129354441 [Poeciliopsis prolifica]|uniref:uncharacterized protein LOC129354441 n=1 Tax=Poeciliopsis prolifica TaxID=188132 RepID=UPI002413FFD5|nr:uncharacterized protein LOC129354441 [Poeciliopsis prolifica]
MFKSFICCQVLKAALVGLLWVAFLLIDGDWWACCFNTLSEQQAALPCKAAAHRSDKERETMAAIKTKSRVSGCWLLLIIVFSGAMSSWTRWRSRCSKGATQYEETLYYKLVLEEEEAVLKEVLRESIRTKLTQQIRTTCEDNWKECFNVAEEVMKNQMKQPEKKDKNVELNQLEESSRLSSEGSIMLRDAVHVRTDLWPSKRPAAGQSLRQLVETQLEVKGQKRAMQAQ